MVYSKQEEDRGHKKSCGPSRSIVRMIGSHLPLKPVPRAHIQVDSLQQETRLQTLKSDPGSSESYPESELETPSLADVLWIVDDEGETFSRLRSEVRPGKQNRRASSMTCLRKVFSSPCFRGRLGSVNMPLTEEFRPPSLEQELAKLRAQIALIIAGKEGSMPAAMPPRCVPGARAESSGLSWLIGSDNQSDESEDEDTRAPLTKAPGPQPSASFPSHLNTVGPHAQAWSSRHVAGKLARVEESAKDPVQLITEAARHKFSASEGTKSEL
uniref:mitochondrial fission regulator 1-like isoform X2 n=1 Tax=Myxine glutinosa TaxID=7769 RepID=UPI00358EA505